MQVRAKFRLSRFEASAWKQGKKDTDGKATNEIETVEMRTLIFEPVYGNGDPEHENTKFWNATPSGEIKLGTVNQRAWENFEIGEEYYVDFTPAS